MKGIIKKKLYFMLFHSRAIDVSLGLIPKRHQKHPCVILLYHRIVDDNSIYLNKGPVVHHHIEHFAREIEFLNRAFQIVSIDELFCAIKTGRGFERPSVVITFDDGYLDNYTLAYPVLKKHGVPAVIYLTTGLIGTMGRTWPDQIELALLKTQKESFAMPELFDDELIHIRTQHEKEIANRRIAEKLKQLWDHERMRFMGMLLAALGQDEELLNNQERIMLNWSEVQKMANDGITFGSHSHSHPILSRLPIDEAKKEILLSKKCIEEHLGAEVKHFAFPNGRAEDFSDELRDYCREIGFETVASVTYGTNSSTVGNVLDLKRIGTNAPAWMMAGDLFMELVRWYKRDKQISS